MAHLSLDASNNLYYEYTAPTGDNAPTFVFVNPITGDVSLWNHEAIVPALQQAGFGTLVYNFRGQANSAWGADVKLTDDLIISDLQRIVADIAPPRPVLCGLSIGGLYASRAILGGTECAGLVLLNTLRKITPRIEWMNAASLRVMEVGGANLMKDLYFHLIMSENFQAANRNAFLSDQPDYTPLAQDTGAYNLLTWMGHSDWDIDWSGLALPTLVIFGLQDRVFYEPAIVDELYALLPDARRIDFPNSGHMVPAEEPEAFGKALIEFGQGL